MEKAKSGMEKLPVLVYFFGGGFVAGDGSEPRYDGESLVYYPHLDVNGVHAALLDPASGYGKPPGMDLRGGQP